MIKLLIGAMLTVALGGTGIGVVEQTVPDSDPFGVQQAAQPAVDAMTQVVKTVEAAKTTPTAAPAAPLTAAQAAASAATFAAEGQTNVTPVPCSAQVNDLSTMLTDAGGNALACGTN